MTIGAIAGIAVGLALPAADILGYPERLSVLASLQVDAATYDGLARSLAAGGSLADLPPLQPPGFVAILAALYAVVGPSVLAAKWLLWTCLVTTTALAAWLGQRVWGPDAAAVAALLVATAPMLRYYTGTVQYEVLVGAWFLALLVLADAATAAWRGARQIVAVTAAAVVAGLLILTREVFLGLVPIVALWMGGRIGRRQGPARGVVMAALFVIVAAIPVALWSADRTARFGRLVIVSDKGPVTFDLGFHRRASGTYDVTVIEPPSGIAYLREEPVGAAHLVAAKAGYFWGLLPDTWNVPRATPLWIHRASFGLIPMKLVEPLARGGWLVAALVVATVVLWRRGRFTEWWILPASVLALCAAHALTLASHRFALPLLPVVYVLIAGPAATALTAAWSWLGGSPRRLAALAVALFAGVAAQWGPWPYEIAFPAAETWGMDAHDVVDAGTGRVERIVRAIDGPRRAVAVVDQHLPAGAFQLLLTVRRGQAPAGSGAVARIEVTELDGTTACAEEVPSGIVPTNRLGAVWIPCRLRSDGPVTILVDGLGVTDLAVHEVVMVRHGPAVAAAARPGAGVE